MCLLDQTAPCCLVPFPVNDEDCPIGKNGVVLSILPPAQSAFEQHGFTLKTRMSKLLFILQQKYGAKSDLIPSLSLTLFLK